MAPGATQVPVSANRLPFLADRYDDCVAVDSRRCASAYTSGGRGPSSAVRRLSARCSMFAVPTIVVCMLGLEMGRMSSRVSGWLFDQSGFNLALKICQVHQVSCKGLPPRTATPRRERGQQGIEVAQVPEFLVATWKADILGPGLCRTIAIVRATETTPPLPAAVVGFIVGAPVARPRRG